MITYNANIKRSSGGPPPKPDFTVPLYACISLVTYKTSELTYPAGTQDGWGQGGSVPFLRFRPLTFISTGQSRYGSTYIIEAQRNIFIPK